ncbi:YAP1-binding protein 1 [Lithohypha guttulata]|uniref:YAP1-binding protein 1 n=1 Tax=Lithohypha guttulata TaxID=1690604 RepID=A0AAN7SXC5_9EURO|nr:YAP1-binding protein 1 [Lithohypha guttulata]
MSVAQGTSHSIEGAQSSAEDPLIAALPPRTDYITYLTILEYQLTPQNLPTLTSLLQEDDGTLATEIGWDLLKLVLPILRIEPDKAQKCLDVIARRGNPREVVVRVAEELERLGQDDSDIEADPSEREDGLPTFAGEAPHVHLGTMSLHGMPSQTKSGVSADKVDLEKDEDTNFAMEEVKLQALLSMLSLLHPRIRTQYPSRFLATSLPAALAAYRRLSMSSASTLAFLNTLTNLAGRKRPALPPRVSTTDVLASAPLPDPESKNETTVAAPSIAANEAAITQRLLQAVLLEVLEEHMTASSEPQPPLTARLRVSLEPDSVTTLRRAEVDGLENNADAGAADKLLVKFASVARDLKLDVLAELQTLDNLDATDEAESESQHDYPTSPAQIPISATALLILYSTQLFQQTLSSKVDTSKTTTLPNSVNPMVLQIVDRQYETDLRMRSSLPAVDVLLSILYLMFCTSEPHHPTNEQPPVTLSRTGTTTESQTLLLAIDNILQDIFLTLPDADLRDNAHHIASHILHGHCQRETRLKIIKTLLLTDNAAARSSVLEAHSGSLKSIAVEWLKAELYPTPRVEKMMARLQPDTERGLTSDHLGNDMWALVFPADKMVPVPAVDVDSQEKEQVVGDFATDMPFYISSMNLLWMMARNHDMSVATAGPAEEEGTSSIVPSAQAAKVDILSKGEEMLSRLVKWKDYLVGHVAVGQTVNSGPNSGRGHNLEAAGVSVTDVFALEDAVGRVLEALEAS